MQNTENEESKMPMVYSTPRVRGGGKLPRAEDSGEEDYRRTPVVGTAVMKVVAVMDVDSSKPKITTPAYHNIDEHVKRP
jgi:hypothetical protein